ncbi:MULTISPECIES: SapC family protein [unclassified Sphingomonas]|jgi:SapC|uniref:SapC family protein n=1 Tax=unclassified Sphingomonas TaxID=196159 RepID=UPI000E10D15C|nr:MULTISPECIES: SapC family protein [unclassified Sphingomonas]AXJ96241.1 multidrug transporter [Sphingomonas sp. FARSPH]
MTSQHAILTAEAHRDLRIRTARDAALGDAQMCCITVPTEFRAVQAEYAILFRLNDTRDRFTALAMFGFENGENLYLDHGRWDARYRPLAVDIQPFLIGGGPDDDGAKQVHVDLASPRIARDDQEGARVFDELGQPTAYLERIAEQLGALDEGYRMSAAFFAALQRYDLLEPFTLEVTLDDGSTNRLVGFHVIDEDRLAALDGAALAELNAAGYLMPLYMAVASLAHLGGLVARRNRRIAHG